MAAVAGIVGAGFIVFVLVWFQPQKLFLNNTVNEPVPGVVQTNPAEESTATTGPAAATPGNTGAVRPIGARAGHCGLRQLPQP